MQDIIIVFFGVYDGEVAAVSETPSVGIIPRHAAAAIQKEAAILDSFIFHIFLPVDRGLAII